MTERLRIEIFPSDIERSLAFYRTLGFTVTGHKDGPPRYASLRLGEIRLGICEAAPVDPVARAHPVGTEIVLEVDDVGGWRDHVVAGGVELTEDLSARRWGLTDFRVTDPDGYYLRFTSVR